MGPSASAVPPNVPIRRSSSPAIEHLCRSVDGVVSVEQSLGYADDDLTMDADPVDLATAGASWPLEGTKWCHSPENRYRISALEDS
jgi:hypothetical protein